MGKTAVIAGAGPAGLTAAYEFLGKTDIRPVIFEMTDCIGGISRTLPFNSNLIDVGPHRFFSKSDVIMNWWLNILPLQQAPARDDILLGRTPPVIDGFNVDAGEAADGVADPEKTDDVMLSRSRLTRIFFLGRFFDYPVSLSGRTLKNLGLARTLKIGLSYGRIRLFPIREEKSLEDFFINRFGRELYETFFKDYTEKVWGIPCTEIEPDWGSQRVKGLSISKVVSHALRKIYPGEDSVSQKQVETSLIERFMYPKLGAGHMWESVARKVVEGGGELHLKHKVVGVEVADGLVKSADVLDESTGEINRIKTDYFLSTMPVNELINCMGDAVPEQVSDVAGGLIHRDLVTLGLLLRDMKIKNTTGIPTINGVIPDNWIYVQERNVKIGRLQIFNNWSPYMFNDFENTVMLGLEYFCSRGDELWRKDDKDFIDFAIGELESIGLIDGKDVIDAAVVRMPKAYPAYFGSYNRFNEVREYTDTIENLFLIGRNGMHRYNNMDHSMLSAIAAVENVRDGVKSKEKIWDVNAEEDYHEEK